MSLQEPSLTDLIRRMQRGDRAAADSVFRQSAARLRRMARSLMARESTNGFHPSDLVQETFVQKIAGDRLKTRVENREHFFSLVAAGMRQVLTDRGRIRNAQKRQAPEHRELEQELRTFDRRRDLTLALAKLERLDPGGRALLRLKYEEALTWEEAAAATGKPVGQLRVENGYLLDWLRSELTA